MSIGPCAAADIGRRLGDLLHIAHVRDMRRSLTAGLANALGDLSALARSKLARTATFAPSRPNRQRRLLADPLRTARDERHLAL